MNAVTRTGTTVKRFQKDVKSLTSGSNLGIATPPLISFMMEIPAVMTRNTTARATDNADVNLKESAKTAYVRSKLGDQENARVRTKTLTNSLETSQRSKHTKSCNEKNKSSSVPPMVTKPSFKNTMMMSPIFCLSSQHITFNNNKTI